MKNATVTHKTRRKLKGQMKISTLLAHPLPEHDQCNSVNKAIKGHYNY